MEGIRKECNGCVYADEDEDCEGNKIFYCVYSCVECNPTYENH